MFKPNSNIPFLPFKHILHNTHYDIVTLSHYIISFLIPFVPLQDLAPPDDLLVITRGAGSTLNAAIPSSVSKQFADNFLKTAIS